MILSESLVRLIFFGGYRPPFGYENGKNGEIDRYGVDHIFIVNKTEPFFRGSFFLIFFMKGKEK